MYDKLKAEDTKCADALKLAQRRYEAISVGKFLTEDGASADASINESGVGASGSKKGSGGLGFVEF